MFNLTGNVNPESFTFQLFNLLLLFACDFNPLRANPTKWSNTLKQFDKLSTSCLCVFDHFAGLALKGLIKMIKIFHVNLQTKRCMNNFKTINALKMKLTFAEAKRT